VDQQVVDLTGRRLIGFKTIISDYQRGQRNIRTICPIIDEIDCSKTTYYEDNFDDMVAVIGSERVTQTLNIDMYSQFYGAGDGHSFCGEQYSIEISDQVPEWMSIMNTNFVTIGTSSPIHLEESFDLMVTIRRED
jgi:hypothetical protein